MTREIIPYQRITNRTKWYLIQAPSGKWKIKVKEWYLFVPIWRCLARGSIGGMDDWCRKEHLVFRDKAAAEDFMEAKVKEYEREHERYRRV